MRKEKVRQIIKEFHKNSKILVVGDVMLDHYISGRATRLSPEAPIPIVTKESDITRPGGAANVACNLSAMGAKCDLIGVVGKDFSLDRLNVLLKGYKICKNGLIIEESRPTTLKQRILANNQQVLRLDFECCAPITPITVEKVFNKIEEKMKKKNISTVVISDYKKGMISSEIIKKILEYDVKVIVDPKGSDYYIYNGAYIMKPNLKEVEDFCNRTIDPTSTNDLREASREIKKVTKCIYVIITLGNNGYSVYNGPRDTLKKFKAIAKEVYDITGAGDSFLAALAASISYGINIYHAAAIGNLAGAAAVQIHGTYPVTPEMILAQ